MDVGVIGGVADLNEIVSHLAEQRDLRVTALGKSLAETAPDHFLVHEPHVYDDYRLLVAEQKLDALFVAGPHSRTHDALRVAAEKKLPVWKSAPLARNLEEGVQLTRRFAQHATRLAAPRPWLLYPAWQQAAEHFDRIGRTFLVRAVSVQRRGPDFGWRGDSARAGGGVLLHDGYPILDLLVSRLGLPAEVSAQITRRTPPPPGHAYDTEDTALVHLRFAPATLGSIELCWISPDSPPVVHFHGFDGSLRVTASEWRLLDAGGELLQQRACAPLNPTTLSIDAFLHDVRLETPLPEHSANFHLAALATIDAAYLAARTGERVAPARLFELQGLRPDHPADDERPSDEDESLFDET